MSLCVHGHFYQPPRENPWTEEVPREPGAAPYHDWNARIAAECYRPNARARVVDDAGRVLAMVNNYRWLSFDVGPTLMSWLEAHQPDTYERIREAQREGGGAIAQSYNHMVLPLASARDVRTQVRWGLADFRHRFGVEAPGIWLPETAVNDEVLAVLAEEGVGFTILAPGQAAQVRGLRRDRPRPWRDASAALDPRVPYRWLHPAGDGRGVDIVFYDGQLSHAVAFESMSSEVLVDRVVHAGRHGGLVTIATDGETFGHHHKFADRGLAYALVNEAPRRGVETINLPEWLKRHRPASEVRVKESAWSCAHGVGRWATDCGCATGAQPGSNQRWRTHLRAALDLLRDFGVEVFERRGKKVLEDPWAARDAYVDVLIGARTPGDFAADHVVGDPIEAFTLLEAQRNAMLMYTSCGWFFHDLAGLETVQVLRYAARVMDLLAELGEPAPEEEFFEVLARARSNDPNEGDGRQVWATHVTPARVDAVRVAAHLVLADLFGLAEPPATSGNAPYPWRLGGFAVESLGAGNTRRGNVALGWRRVALRHLRTGRREELMAVALRLGDLEAVGAVRPARWPGDALAVDVLRAALHREENPGALAERLARFFGPESFDLSAILPEAAETLCGQALAGLADQLAGLTESFLASAHWSFLSRPAGETHHPVKLSSRLRVPAEVAVARRLEQELAAGNGIGPVLELAGRARQAGFSLDAPNLRAVLDRLVLEAVRKAVEDPGTASAPLTLLGLAEELGITPDVERAQELVYQAVAGGAAPELRPLAEALGIAPAVWQSPAAEAVPPAAAEA
jgi:alpha-amylase/alpha-mannosidase (GH57 family)